MFTSKALIFVHLNLAKHLANHLVGENHTLKHRVVFGGSIMIVGVLISKMGVIFPLLHIPLDMLGYLIHGIGGIPVVETIIQTTKEGKETEATKAIQNEDTSNRHSEISIYRQGRSYRSLVSTSRGKPARRTRKEVSYRTKASGIFQR